MSDYGPLVELDSPAYLHPNAQLYGKIHLAPETSVWPFVSMRAEDNEIRVGRGTNIQDFVMIHVGYDTPSIIGEYCSITHHCTVHGASIGANTLVGINATIMDACVIGKNCIIGGGTFLKEKTVIPDNSIVVGSPGKVIKTRNNYVANKMNALFYIRNAQFYARGDHRSWAGSEGKRWAAEQVQLLQKEFRALVEAGKEAMP